MRTKKIIGGTAAVLVVALLAGLYFFAPRQAEDFDAFDGLILVDRAEDEVAEIFFRIADETETLRPRRGDDGEITWRYSGARGFQLCPFQLRSKARPAFQLRAAQVIHEDTTGLNMEDFGFDPPIVIIETNFLDGSTFRMDMGIPTADFQHYFVLVDGDPAMYLIDGNDGWNLALGVADMLDTSIPPIRAEELQFARISGMPDIVLSGENGELTMIEPTPGAVIPEAVQELVLSPISQIHILGLEDLQPDDLEPFGLDAPLLEVELRSETDEVHLQFGTPFIHEETELIYVKFAGRPHVFVAEAWHAGQIASIEIADILEGAQ